jgi:hypothetical protein
MAFLHYDARRDMLRERLAPAGARPHLIKYSDLPETLRHRVSAGERFIDVTDKSADYSRLFGFGCFDGEGLLCRCADCA